MAPAAVQQPAAGIVSKSPTSFWKSRVCGVVRRFTPSWFAVTMGTGIISILLCKLPYDGAWLYWISVAIFVLDVSLFTLFFSISAMRYLCYPEIWQAMIKHPVESLPLGTFPMSLGIIIQGIISICVPAWGPWAVTLAWALWWIEVVTSIAICFYLPFITMSIHEVEISSVTTFWLLPIVSTVICAATGGMVADALTNAAHALWTLIVSYILWGIGIPLATFTLVLYYHRLTMYKIPPREIVSSVFLPLGPLGEGGFGIMKLGQVSLRVLPATHTLIPEAGQTVYIFGFLTALLMWGFALVWLFWAFASFGRAKSPFNMGWWSIVFATGVFTGSTITMGQEMGSRFFDALGTAFTVIVILFWIVVSIYTICGTISGELLFSPCLAQPEETEQS